MSSSSRRRALALLAVAPLAACGFTPVYGTGGAGRALRGRVSVEAPTNRLGFVLVARLEERLGRAADPQYALSYTLNTSTTGLAITGADDITRRTLNGTLQFRLVDQTTGDSLQSGEVRSFSSYATTGSPVATRAALRDAQDRLMIGLADQVVTRLFATPGLGA